jgi:hypothetical protein
MPQTGAVRTNEITQHPEHVAEAAEHSHDKAAHPTAHEETVQAEDRSRHEGEHASKLTHGKAARLEAEIERDK